jgi:hypothetical protein
LHDGRCVDLWNNVHPELKFTGPTDYKCFCDPHFSGLHCEVTHHACQSSPCANGATCLDALQDPEMSFGAKGYKCICKDKFMGELCDRLAHAIV